MTVGHFLFRQYNDSAKRRFDEMTFRENDVARASTIKLEMSKLFLQQFACVLSVFNSADERGKKCKKVKGNTFSFYIFLD